MRCEPLLCVLDQCVSLGHQDVVCGFRARCDLLADGLALSLVAVQDGLRCGSAINGGELPAEVEGVLHTSVGDERAVEPHSCCPADADASPRGFLTACSRLFRS
jgi:hypothetical protein